MGYVQIAVAGGAMLGYLVGEHHSGKSITYSPGPGQRLLDSAKHHHHHHPKGFCAQLKRLLASPLFVCMTFALCALYFVVTGVQYWVMQ
ncbi:hypothetical protein Pmar_PMAR004698 [Perkinsus marinus ATCC 50983]|uniref:Uncharacterized protein n=1 Tax=Perkinsus marinus (strain ATCC 50983 / TXsc) TaxID=423536 RepID=C5KF45_PERM5|nr:hypothetical protein Pmar_PMAR004698 [Perkinsus marinus ATCC 50983]EER16847.1 hypothetical protein Pmar_PMAR004698 [Perkinsus marinus ATCC 50983]|eukprot:XP_002785051.1 hypothetical protein Pmar_PMAR004698 [Perkinsus marinus ATCC 50983]